MVHLLQFVPERSDHQRDVASGEVRSGVRGTTRHARVRATGGLRPDRARRGAFSGRASEGSLRDSSCEESRSGARGGSSAQSSQEV